MITGTLLRTMSVNSSKKVNTSAKIKNVASTIPKYQSEVAQDHVVQNEREPCAEVGQEEPAFAVEALEQAPVELVPRPMGEAHQVQRRRRDELEIGRGGEPGGELAGEFDMAAEVILQALDAVVADDEPELEGAEPAAQRHLPVAIIDDRARLGRLISEVLRQHAQGLDERRPVGNVEAVAVEIGEQPLVRVEGVGIGQLEPVEEVAELRAEGGGAGHGAVHVQPETVPAADGAEVGERIEAVGGGRAGGGGDETRHEAGLAILGDLGCQGLGAHGAMLVRLDKAQVAAPQTRYLHGLLDGGMGVRRGVGNQPAGAAGFVGLEAGGALAGGQQGAEHRARGAVLDHAASQAAGLEAGRQARHVRQPIQHVGFQFGAGGAGRPQHPLHPQTRREQLAQDGRAGVVGGEVGEEIRRLPMRDAGQDQPVHVREDGLEGLPLRGGVGRQRGADLPGLDRRADRQRLDALLVGRYPIHQRMAPAPKLLRAHVETGRVVHRAEHSRPGWPRRKDFANVRNEKRGIFLVSAASRTTPRPFRVAGRMAEIAKRVDCVELAPAFVRRSLHPSCFLVCRWSLVAHFSFFILVYP